MILKQKIITITLLIQVDRLLVLVQLEAVVLLSRRSTIIDDDDMIASAPASVVGEVAAAPPEVDDGIGIIAVAVLVESSSNIFVVLDLDFVGVVLDDECHTSL